MEVRKSALRQQVPVFLAQFLLCGAMVAVYGVLGKFSPMVLYGALTGMLVSMLNHLGLILSVLNAENSESPEKGQLKIRGTYLLRMLLMVGLLVLALKYVGTHPIATLLPLILMRLALYIGGAIMKKEGKGEE